MSKNLQKIIKIKFYYQIGVLGKAVGYVNNFQNGHRKNIFLSLKIEFRKYVFFYLHIF